MAFAEAQKEHVVELSRVEFENGMLMYLVDTEKAATLSSRQYFHLPPLVCSLIANAGEFFGHGRPERNMELGS